MISFKPLQKELNKLSKVHAKAEIAAMNRAARTARSEVVQSIREDYNIKASELKANIEIIKANKHRPYVLIKSKHKSIALYKFKARQLTKGTKAAIRKGGRKMYKGAFVQEMRTGHTGVYQRKGKSKYPIKELYGPSAMQLLGTKQSLDKIEKIFIERFGIEYDRQLDRWRSK